MDVENMYTLSMCCPGCGHEFTLAVGTLAENNNAINQPPEITGREREEVPPLVCFGCGNDPCSCHPDIL